MGVYEFDCVIYPRVLWVSCHCPTEELRSMFGEEIGDMSEDNDAEVLSCESVDGDHRGGVLIRFRSRSVMTEREIAHESIHAALEIFEYIGAGVDYWNQEPLAYLVGWIAECCKKVKNGTYGKE